MHTFFITTINWRLKKKFAKSGSSVANIIQFLVRSIKHQQVLKEINEYFIPSMSLYKIHHTVNNYNL